MGIGWVREYCLTLPHVTEDIAWETHVVFRIAQKIFCITTPEPPGAFLSVKVTPEHFAELVERPGVNPASHVGRYHWIAMESEDALPRAEVRELIRESYGLIRAKLPKKYRQD